MGPGELLVMGSIALANEAPGADPPAAPAQTEDADWLRHTNSGFGVGAAHLGVPGAPGAQRFGLLLDLRKEKALSHRVQLNAVLSAGVTRPRNTAAVASWAWGAGGSITSSYGDVSRWVRESRGTGEHSLRQLGAVFAYTGLTFSYLVVPVGLLVSPLSSVGHVIGGATISVHSGSGTRNAYVEGGWGGIAFTHPVSGAPAVGCGPMLGAGTQLGSQTLGARVVVSPPGLNVAVGKLTDLVLSGSVAVGF